MTKRFFTLLFAFAAMVTTADAQVVFNVPDPVFQQWFYQTYSDLRYYKEEQDENGNMHWREIRNGEIIPASVVAQMAGETTLWLNGQGISSLKGIEYFPALKRLYCYNNQLTSLDVSKNTALETLYCYNNQLTSLNISGCTALRQLECNNNQLSSLDVSGYTMLGSLRCYDNRLTSLNVSGCTALVWLDCHSNQLTSLDVSNLSNSNYSDYLGVLYCYNNRINEDGMETLINGINSFALKYNKDEDRFYRLAKQIYIFSNIDEEEGNVCTREQVKALLEKNWDPYYLAYSGNISFNNDYKTHFRKYWGIAPNVQPVEFNEDNFPDVNFRKVISKEFNIQEGENFTPIDMSAISMDVCWNNIENLKGIEHFVALENLNCYENQLTSLDVSKNTALESLRCYDNKLTSLDVSKNTALTYLSCSGNLLTSLVVSKNTAALQYLYCYSNQIKGEAMDELVASLPAVENGYFHVINTKDENEGNVCTKTQVAIAKGKGWTVYDYNGGSRQQYDGSDKAIFLDAETFPDDNFRTALAKDLGIAEGDEINTGLIVATTKIDVSNGKITMLSGIEYFTALTTIYCQSNMMPDNAMKGLIAALPDLSSNEAKGLMRAEETNPRTGALYALNFTDENEQNVCTAEHVAAANEKGWTVYCKTTNGWQEYNGEVPTGIHSIDNGKLTIDNWYSVDGVKLQGEPMRKGVYIVNGRKVVK